MPSQCSLQAVNLIVESQEYSSSCNAWKQSLLQFRLRLANEWLSVLQHKLERLPDAASLLGRRASAEMVLDKDHAFPTPLKRHGGRKVPSGPQTVKTAAPRLSIVMLVCGTRGDVQPFIALGLKMKVRDTSACTEPFSCAMLQRHLVKPCIVLDKNI